MRTDRKISGGCWIGLLAALVMGGTVSAQSPSTSPVSSGSSSTLATFLQERQVLAQRRQALISQGATQQQMQAWRQQNASQFQALQQLATQLVSTSSVQPLRTMAQANNIPANASSTLADFLTARANLANARARIYNQLLLALPSGSTEAQAQAIRQQANQTFQQQYAGDIQLQTQRLQALAAESAAQPRAVPGPAVIPPGASPQLRAYLTARNALASDRAQLWNQYLTTDPATRQAAMQQWRQQNASRIEQLHTLAQDLSNSTSNQEEETQ